MLLVGVALNGVSVSSTVARAGLDQRFQAPMALPGAIHDNRLPLTTRSPYDALGVYSLIGDSPDAAATIARTSHLQLGDTLPLTGVTLEQPDVEAVNRTTADATSTLQVWLISNAELTARLATAFETDAPALRQPWTFHGNGGSGFKTWLSDQHALDFNPAWLDFSMFDSLKLDVMSGPVGPGESEPQLWRSSITVGMGAAWEFHPGLALQAGYRFYENPMPTDRTSGALLNATQHVLATGLTYRQGAHSVSLIYGLDLLDAAEGASISSARYGDHLASTAHLVSFVYAFAF